MAPEGLRTGVSQVDLSLPFPTEWREVGQIEKLFIYPLKSARGHLVDKAQVSNVKLNVFDKENSFG